MYMCCGAHVYVSVCVFLSFSFSGTRLLFKFRSGTHDGLNEELGRHKVGHNACCVMMSVRGLLMCRVIVQHMILLEFYGRAFAFTRI